MKNRCVQTGAQVFIEERNEFGNCDVYEIGGVHVFRFNSYSITSTPMNRINFSITKIDLEFREGNVTTVMAETLHVKDLGRSGRAPLKLL